MVISNQCGTPAERRQILPRTDIAKTRYRQAVILQRPLQAAGNVRRFLLRRNIKIIGPVTFSRFARAATMPATGGSNMVSGPHLPITVNDR
jgi:hypothetical protein